MTLKNFIQTIKGNDFEVYNQNEELIFTTIAYKYNEHTLLPFAKYDVDLVELCLNENLRPYAKIYIIKEN